MRSPLSFPPPACPDRAKRFPQRDQTAEKRRLRDVRSDPSRTACRSRRQTPRRPASGPRANGPKPPDRAPGRLASRKPTESETVATRASRPTTPQERKESRRQNVRPDAPPTRSAPRRLKRPCRYGSQRRMAVRDRKTAVRLPNDRPGGRSAPSGRHPQRLKPARPLRSRPPALAVVGTQAKRPAASLPAAQHSPPTAALSPRQVVRSPRSAGKLGPPPALPRSRQPDIRLATRRPMRQALSQEEASSPQSGRPTARGAGARLRSTAPAPPFLSAQASNNAGA
jgi:hypothetical protein